MQGDRELLDRARSGDPRAVDEILARHEKQVFRFGLRMCGNEDDARDVLQETLLAAFRNLRGFRGDAQLSTWLFQIARSFCTKSRRRGVAEPAAHEPLEGAAATAAAASELAPDAQAHARQISAILQSAIGSLGQQQREALVLRDVEGLSAEEAASVIGIEVGALKSRLHRARVELRQRLASMLADDASPCPELAEELSAYAAQEIDQAACARIEEHLGRCARCKGACAELQRTVSLCRQIPGDEVPARVREQVRAALLSAATPTSPDR
jgi:RNA polymerase sigma-70 factor (ECF subfamily)